LFLLTNLSDLFESLVGQNVSVFGIAQTPLIYFECALLLIPKVGENCQVPECGEATNRTRRGFDESDDQSVEVQSQRIEISELGVVSVADDVMESVELTCHDRPSFSSRQICVALNPFMIVLAGMISVVVFAAFVAVIVTLQRYRHYSISRTAC
uniref:ZP domain-containing protein n=1 Tax=Heligmosomoides polygyrus TaxID=6339 RepID=A0A183F8E2_HELPZ